MCEKIRCILEVAEQENHSTLILGAWGKCRYSHQLLTHFNFIFTHPSPGCGAFGNSARVVAAAMKKEIDLMFPNHLKNIVFAIIGSKCNFESFRDVFDN